MDLADELWKDVLIGANSSSSCAWLSLIQLKVIHRVHLSKASLCEIYPESDPESDPCGGP